MCEGHQRQQRLPQVVHVTCLCPPRPKGDHLDVKAVGESGSAVQQCFVAFDVLLVDGQNLANRPQQERADILSTWVGEGWGREGRGGVGEERGEGKGGKGRGGEGRLALDFVFVVAGCLLQCLATCTWWSEGRAAPSGWGWV